MALDCSIGQSGGRDGLQGHCPTTCAHPAHTHAHPTPHPAQPSAPSAATPSPAWRSQGPSLGCTRGSSAARSMLSTWQPLLPAWLRPWQRMRCGAASTGARRGATTWTAPDPQAGVSLEGGPGSLKRVASGAMPVAVGPAPAPCMGVVGSGLMPDDCQVAQSWRATLARMHVL